MRNKYTAQLKALNDALIDMGNMCQNAISLSCQALSSGDLELANKIFASDDMVDKQERDIESMCLSLILHQQPVASDLHAISAALKMITDLERIGDHACDIAEIMLHNKSGTLTMLHEIENMVSCVVTMLHTAIEAYIKRDLDMARGVYDLDDEVDTMFFNIKEHLIEKLKSDSASIGHDVLDVLMVAKYLERIGDHACNVAGWVVFAITGEHKHQNQP